MHKRNAKATVSQLTVAFCLVFVLSLFYIENSGGDK